MNEKWGICINFNVIDKSQKDIYEQNVWQEMTI